MKSHDEIKKGLECCLDHVFCAGEGCPYYKVQSEYCDLMSDALALIQQYEKTINILAEENADVHKKCDSLRLRVENREESLKHLNNLRDAAAGRALKMEERVHQLEAERDAAVEDMKTIVITGPEMNCEFCKHADENKCRKICDLNFGAFEWRGVQKEDGNAKSP